MSSPVVSFTGVGKRYPLTDRVVAALIDVDMTIEPGAFVGVVGPSGSGKSTLAHLAALLDLPSAGSVAFAGTPVERLDDGALSRLRGERIGVVFQRYHLLPDRTALANVLFRFRYLRQPDTYERAMAALTAVGMGEKADRLARTLSGGEMQRVAVARAIVHDPALLVADEPTGNLDEANGEEIMEIFGDLHRQGRTILMVTHDRRLLRYCDRIIEVSDGTIWG